MSEFIDNWHGDKCHKCKSQDIFEVKVCNNIVGVG